MERRYKILDILHTGHHGPLGERKIGKKYDQRRNTVVEIDFDKYSPGDDLVFKKDNKSFLYTTPYTGLNAIDNEFYVNTINSIYVMKEVKE